MGRALAALLSVALPLAAAHGQDADALDPPVRVTPALVPSAGLATEDGPGALWINPANLAYDPDPRWGLFFRGHPGAPVGEPRAMAGATAGFAGVSAGVRWLRTDAGRNDIALDLGTGLQLPKRIAVGGGFHWNLVAGQANYVAFDAAIAWRPLPWIGLAAVTRNIGDPGRDLGDAIPETGAGVAVRPLGRTFVLGADYLRRFAPVEHPDLFRFTARVRPTEGLFFRAHLDTTLNFGAGVEVYFGGAGVGLHAEVDDLQGWPAITGFVASEEPEENLAPSKRRVSKLVLRDTPSYEPTLRLFGQGPPTWFEVLEQFRRAEEDPGILGMIVTLDGIALPWARWQELRSAIVRLRTRDKQVLVYLTGAPGTGAVYAASAASDVFAHPATVLDLTGVSQDLVYLGGTLDALGVEIEVVRTGEHKSAAEELTRRGPSDADLAQREAWLDDVHRALVEALATGRQRTTDVARGWVDGGPWSAREAETEGLVDGRAYPDQLDALLTERLGRAPRLIDLARVRRGRSGWDAPDEIAVVYVEGPIVPGTSSPGLFFGPKTAGALTLARQLDLAARDLKVRAVVIRVDSPGGSAFASDAIWRAVERVKAAGKPVVVSMGGVAASGGYYVATGADSIWAEPTTLTGSIGVISTKPDVSGLLDRLGMTTTQLRRGRMAGADSVLRGWDPLERARREALVGEIYATFVDRVATGRGMTTEAVEAVAGGRVWSGVDAREEGLVDELGGLMEAIDHARVLADIPERRSVEVVGVRTPSGLLERILPGTAGLSAALRARRIAQARERLALGGLLDAAPLRPVLTWAQLEATVPEPLWLLDPWAVGTRADTR